MSQNVFPDFSGTTPAWVVARRQPEIYVLTQGDDQLVQAIDTATNTVLNSFPVGAGRTTCSTKVNLNRCYVTNPATATVYVFWPRAAR